MNVDLGSEKTITAQPVITVTTKTVTVVRMVDFPLEKQVIVFLKEVPGKPILLWEGADYDSIGQWTNDDVIARLSEAGILT